MIYGYCRISTQKQSIERQIKNIMSTYPTAAIVQEIYTGTKIIPITLYCSFGIVLYGTVYQKLTDRAFYKHKNTSECNIQEVFLCVIIQKMFVTTYRMYVITVINSKD